MISNNYAIGSSSNNKLETTGTNINLLINMYWYIYILIIFILSENVHKFSSFYSNVFSFASMIGLITDMISVIGSARAFNIDISYN